MSSTSILDLGDPRDARAWEAGCRRLGFSNAIEPIRSSKPPLQSLLGLMKSQPEWLFMSGHYAGLELYNGGVTSLSFSRDAISIKATDGNQTVTKGQAEFGLDRNCKLSIWGGCSVAGSRTMVQTLFALLGPHVILGFDGKIGSQITEALLGGGFLKKGHFFDNVEGHEDDPAAIRDAWLQAAINGYRGGTGKDSVDETLFRAIDPDGREWYTEGGKKVRGQMML
jgi:hypothetical protein